MTSHGSKPEARKPNYTLRRIKTLLAIIACTASATLLFTWRTADSQTATVRVSVVYILTGLWLTVRFAPRDQRLPTSRQSNKTNQLGMFSRTSTFTHVGWREHITEYRQTTNPPRRLHTHFCRGFGWATVRPSTDSNLLLSKYMQALRCLRFLSYYA